MRGGLAGPAMGMTWALLVFCGLCWGVAAGAPQAGERPQRTRPLAEVQQPKMEVHQERPPMSGGAVRSESQQEQSTRVIKTIPWVQLDGRRVALQEALKEDPPPRLFITLDVEGEELELELKQNQELFRGGHSLMSYLPDGTRVTDSAEKLVNCYYHARVRGLPHSWGSVSTCSGLRGHLFLSGSRSYNIAPVEGDRDGTHHLTWTHDASGLKQAHSASYGQPAMPSEGHMPHSRRLRRDVATETKYIEMVIVADKKEYMNYNSDLRLLQQRMLELANQVDAFYQLLQVRVALVGLEVWNQQDQIVVDKNPAVTLDRFLAWRQAKLLPQIPHDNAQLLVGAPFEGSSVGMASHASMCSRERSGAVNVDHSVSILSVASTVAHELGHNLGISHDTDLRKCICPRSLLVRSCIMESSSGFMPGLAFSSCSRSDLELSLRQGIGMCLFNVPEPKSLKRQSCGNLFIEAGEECDCGLTEECKDPCCNATTCKLVPRAECSSSGNCCQDCKLKSLGTTCRETLGECDLPEYCNGESPHCPDNVYLQNGEACNGGRAHCYSGVCRSYDSQCQALWGPGSSQAPEVCFSIVNGKGDKFGNCGQVSNGSFVPCGQRDVKCGKIQCHRVRELPILGSKVETTASWVTVNKTKVLCQGAYFNLGDDVTDPALVMSGTSCGEGKVCLNQKCQDVATLGAQKCNNKCNGRGVCNSNGNCHCEDGWAPPDCKNSGPGGSLDSGPLEQRAGSSGLTTALLILFLLVLPLIILLVLCFLKRSLMQKLLGNFNKGTSCQQREEAETRVRFLGEAAAADRNRALPPASRQPPGRPRPPQRAQSTELQVMPISIKDSDRPGPPSKPLPPDPVPKHLQAADPDRPAAPTRPLPADPVVRKSQPPLSAKPLPPAKQPRHSRASSLDEEGLPSVVPIYHPPVLAFPSRPAPPPPTTLAGDPHVQTT